MAVMPHRFIISTWVLSLYMLVVRAAGNTTCKTSSLDWYTSVVGETPCQTYQSLRQICNSAYTVDDLSVNTPPDTCNDQVSSCCCNSVAFALSMLCLNCQQGVGTLQNGDMGIDAGNGSYQIYSATCGVPLDQSLPVDIQTAVCNEKLKIDNDLYSLFWVPGAWFYAYTRETMQKNMLEHNNNVFTHCASTTVANTTVSGTPTGTQTTPAVTKTPIKSSGSLSGGAIGGIAVGAVAVLAVIIGGLFWLYRRYGHRMSAGMIRPTREMEEAAMDIEPFRPDGPDANFDPFSMAEASHVNIPPNSLISPYTASQPSTRPSRKHLLAAQDSNGGGPSSSSAHASSPPSIPSSEPLPEHHQDAGPLGRSPSGRLPPAYGDQTAY